MRRRYDVLRVLFALVSSLVLGVAPCAGAPLEVPARLLGWADADAAWLEQELAAWMKQRERELCAPTRSGPDELSVALRELDVEIHFLGRARTVVRTGGVDELFRYQVAAATEELLRSTWEQPPPPRFKLFALGIVRPLATGPLLVGGGAGLAFAPEPWLSLEASGAGAAVLPLAVEGATVRGNLVTATLAASWLPLRVGLLSAGPRLAARAGALGLEVLSADGSRVVATTPWLDLGGGVVVGLSGRRFSVDLVAEVNSALLGAAVLSEGVRVASLRGLMGSFSLEAGWRW